MSAGPIVGWVVDVQRDFMDPPEAGGRLYVHDLFDASDPGAVRALPAIERTVAWLRAHADALVYTGDWHAADDREIDAVAPDATRGTYPPHCMGLSPDPAERRGAELVPSVAPDAEATIVLGRDASDGDARRTAAAAIEGQAVFVHKREFSVFEGNPGAGALVEALAAGLARRAGAAPTFVVCGVAADVCVRQAVEGLLARGQRVAVVRDATWGLGLERLEVMLARWEEAGARVVASDGLDATLAVSTGRCTTSWVAEEISGGGRMDGPVPGGWTAAEQEEIWARRRGGEALRTIARHFGRDIAYVRRFLLHTGGRRLPPRRRAAGQLTAPEREEVSRGLAAGESCRAIAARLGRAHTTVSREVARNGGAAHYRAGDADGAAWRRAKRPKPAVLAARPVLRAVVEAKLARRWSPEQVAHWLRRAYPDDPSMRVSHETIYLSLFVQTRGALKRELTKELRTGRAMRFPRGARARRGQGHGQLVSTVSIRERPAEVEDRAVPGHWEGDLVFGRHHSAVGTLVERTTRYALLFPVPGGYKGGPMREALAAAITRLPAQLRRSLTWDNGKEMSEHGRFTVDSGVQVYICDPRSPWQRGTNENTNGLLRQYLPKAADLRALDQAALDAIAAELNGRPRETLDWRSPAERFAELAGGG